MELGNIKKTIVFEKKKGFEQATSFPDRLQWGNFTND